MVRFLCKRQVFQIPGMGLMAAMAQRSSASGSAIYMWNQTGFQLYQNISTYGALAWRHFTMGKKVEVRDEDLGGLSEQEREKCPAGSFLCFWFLHLDVFGGVQLWRRAGEAVQHRVTNGLLCDLQVEQKAETVCDAANFTNALCPRLGGLQNQSSYLPRRGESQTR